MNRRKAIAGVIGSIGALFMGKEATACGYDASMSSNSSTNENRVAAGINTCGGGVYLKLYNGGWGFLGSAYSSGTTAYLHWSAPAVNTDIPYWMKVYRRSDGKLLHQEFFYRRYRF